MPQSNYTIAELIADIKNNAEMNRAADFLVHARAEYPAFMQTFEECLYARPDEVIEKLCQRDSRAQILRLIPGVYDAVTKLQVILRGRKELQK